MNTQAVTKRFPLCKACYYNRFEVIKLLLNQPGIDITLTEKKGRTALHTTVMGIKPKESGRAINFDKSHSAQIVTLLLEKGANINAQDMYYYTPLHFAAACNYRECVEILLSHHADVNLKNANGETALIKACKKNNVEIIKLLLAQKPDLYTQDNLGKMAIDWTIAHPETYPILFEELKGCAQPEIIRRHFCQLLQPSERNSGYLSLKLFLDQFIDQIDYEEGYGDCLVKLEDAALFNRLVFQHWKLSNEQLESLVKKMVQSRNWPILTSMQEFVGDHCFRDFGILEQALEMGEPQQIKFVFQTIRFDFLNSVVDKGTQNNIYHHLTLTKASDSFLFFLNQVVPAEVSEILIKRENSDKMTCSDLAILFQSAPIIEAIRDFAKSNKLQIEGLSKF